MAGDEPGLRAVPATTSGRYRQPVLPLLLPLLLLLLGITASRPVLACQCIRGGPAGFIHPDVTVLPHNARGMLFHAPSDLALTPALFAVSSSSALSPPRVRIEPIDLPPDHPMRARLPADGRLVRIGVEGGFAADASYTVSYLAPAPRFSTAHAEVRFSIDAAPLDLATARFAVELDGPARRTMLPMATDDGACAASEPVLAQGFQVRVPRELQRYLPALSLLAEAQDGLPGAAFAPVQYRPSLCAPALFDRSVAGLGKDLLVRDCRTGADRIRLRARVGMLEVDERFVLAEAASVEPASARTPGCAPFAMLRDAADRGDDGEAAHLACELARPGGFTLGALDLDPARAPTLEQWTRLQRQADGRRAACALPAMRRMLLMARHVGPELRDAYLALVKEKLGGADQDEVKDTLLQLDDLQRMMRRREDKATSGWPRDAVLPLLPALLPLAQAGGPGAPAALRVIGSIGPAARATAPRLMRLAGQDGPQAEAAVQALEHIMADDPAFQDALLRWAGRPALRQTAALAFLRVAGKARPQQAIALLVPLAREDNGFAIDGLATLGTAAASTMPLLLEKAQHAPQDYLRSQALRAAIRVAPDDATAAQALARTLLEQPRRDLMSSSYAGIQRFRQHAAVFTPVLERAVEAVRWEWEADNVRTLVRAMALPPLQKADLLGKLERQVSQHWPAR